MRTLVQIKNAQSSSVEAASLVADYLAFDKRRTERRQYQKAFGGMGIGEAVSIAVFGSVMTTAVFSRVNSRMSSWP